MRPALQFLADWLLAILIGLDVTANAILLGRKYQTISSRIGESIKAGGWAARVPWPAWFRDHCLRSIAQVVV